MKKIRVLKNIASNKARDGILNPCFISPLVACLFEIEKKEVRSQRLRGRVEKIWYDQPESSTCTYAGLSRFWVGFDTSFNSRGSGKFHSRTVLPEVEEWLATCRSNSTSARVRVAIITIY